MDGKQVKEILARCNVAAFNLLSRSALAIGPDEVARQLLRENPFFGSIDIVIPYQEDARWDDVQMPIDMRFDDDEERAETLKDWQLGFAKYISEITPARDEIIMMAVALAEAIQRAEIAEDHRNQAMSAYNMRNEEFHEANRNYQRKILELDEMQKILEDIVTADHRANWCDDKNAGEDLSRAIGTAEILLARLGSKQ